MRAFIQGRVEGRRGGYVVLCGGSFQHLGNTLAEKGFRTPTLEKGEKRKFLRGEGHLRRRNWSKSQKEGLGEEKTKKTKGFRKS